jgi:hypothetical protein
MLFLRSTILSSLVLITSVPALSKPFHATIVAPRQENGAHTQDMVCGDIIIQARNGAYRQIPFHSKYSYLILDRVLDLLRQPCVRMPLKGAL